MQGVFVAVGSLGKSDLRKTTTTRGNKSYYREGHTDALLLAAEEE
jgi:hypothetical protein